MTCPDPVMEQPDFPVFTDLNEALASRPDLVIVSTTTASHLQIAIPAASAGCNLFIEKPLSHTWDGVEDLISIVRQRNLKALVGYDLRFDPGLSRIKTLLDDECIGRCFSIQAQVGQYLPDWHPWEDYRQTASASSKKGGGVILDLVHELDFVTWLLGPVTEVSCIAGKVSALEIETEDTAAMILKFRSGAIGTIHLDYLQRVPSRTCRIIGEKGTILWDYFGKQVLLYDSKDLSPMRFEYPESQRNDRFVEEMRHLLGCIAGEVEPRVDIETASRSLKLALTAKQSALTGEVCRITD
jgi:predicted dehydrogenase